MDQSLVTSAPTESVAGFILRKSFFLYFIILFCALTVQAQFTDDLASKRSYLTFLVRDLGPLPPNDWATFPLYVVNEETPITDFAYHAMGNFGYIGNSGDDYFYGYFGTGFWTYADPGKAATGLRFDHFGLHEAEIDPYPTYYHFAMDTADYNIAGLKYEALEIITGEDASGNLIGYNITPGESFFTSYLYDPAITFDLEQNVETPSFKVADYYFGLWPNFPPDSTLPGPQVTQSQSSGALYVSGVGVTNLIISWVKEGVYRPDGSLPPGISSPLVYTYMEQYFDGPFRADPLTGMVPRLSSPNWNGVEKIDTNNAVRTTYLTPQGRFIPNTWGKQILITRPLENGDYGEWPFYVLQMFVDQNRDGILDTNDVTTAANPHVFWVNNDCDRSTYSDDDLWDEQDIQTNVTTVSDAEFVKENFRIPSLRDLEDYDRLDIRGLSELCRDLPTGQGYTVKLRWKHISSGNPGIFVFQSVDTSGGSAYLTDPATAAAQIYPTLYPTNYNDPGPSTLAVGRVESGLSAVLVNDSLINNDHFIYCGTSRGSGELACSVYKGSTLIGETSLFLDIRDVKELYERWTLGDGNGGTPATTPTLVSDGLPPGVSATYFNDSPFSNQKYILFVHGWNLAPWEKDTFAETAFKRLYWQGYTGRFGSLRWPTEYGFQDKLFYYPGPLTDPDNYDRSELTAWQAGEGMRQHILNLDSRYTANNVYLLAHSMGNIVAGEALALNAEKYGGGEIVNTYIASQAAVPLDCYKPNGSDSVFQMPFVYKHPLQEEIASYIAQWPGYGWILSYPLNQPLNWDSGTPNIYIGWLETNQVSCISRVNFYNPHDFALSMEAWGFNELLKPDTSGSTEYSYHTFSNNNGLPLVGDEFLPPPYFIFPPPARTGMLPPAGIWQQPGYFEADDGSTARYLNFEFNQNDMYETMAFADEARSYALGATPDGLARQFDLRTVWPDDPDPDPNLLDYGRHKWHSAEFRSNYFSQQGYWNLLMSDIGFNLR